MLRTVRFSAHPDGYRCSEPGDNGGEYVWADTARDLLAQRDALLAAVQDAAEQCSQALKDSGVEGWTVEHMMHQLVEIRATLDEVALCEPPTPEKEIA